MEFGADPNKSPEMILRGQSSIDLSIDDVNIKGNYATAPNAPLFILDGFEATIEKIMDLDMDQVESLTILKDASAKAIYGSKAANGVVVIETKHALGGDLRVTYSGNLNIEAPDLSSYNLTNAAQKLELEKDFGLYDSKNIDEQLKLHRLYFQKYKAVVAGVNTDWMAKPLRNGIGQRHSLSIDLGGKDLAVLAVISYNKVTGVMKGSERQTYNGNVSVSYRNKNINFRNQLNISSNIGNDSPYGTFSDYALMNPYYSPYDVNGLLVKNAALTVDGINPQDAEYVQNPLYNASLNIKKETRYLDVTNNFYAEWNAFKGLNASLRFGITERRTSGDEFYPANHLKFDRYSAEDFDKKGSYQANNGHQKKLSGDLNIRYSTQIKEHHYLFSNIGFNISDDTHEEVYYQAVGFPNDRMTDIIFARKFAENSKPNGRESTTHDMGVLGVLNYTYDNKYLLDLSFRANASSQFGANNRWGKFWSLGLGWNIHKENFINEEIFNNLKLRGSLGYTGSQTSNAYSSLGTYLYESERTYKGNLIANLKGIKNDDLKWQRKMDYNIGLDINIRRRVSLTFDVYRSVTENMLTSITLPPSVGFNSLQENMGKAINTGWDLRSSFTVLENTRERSFLTVNISMSHNKNRIDKLSDAMQSYNERQQSLAAKPDNTRPVRMYYDGCSLSSIWGMKSLGIDPRNGREIYLMRDGTPTYTYNSSEQVILGNTLPKVQGNAGLSFEWKGLGGNASFTFKWGGQMYNTTLIDKVENADITQNVDIRLFDGVWRPGDEGKVKPYKQLGSVYISETGEFATLKTNPTSRFVQNNNELKLTNLSLYYDFYRWRFLKRADWKG